MLDGVIPAIRSARDLVKVVESVFHAPWAIDPMTSDFMSAVGALVRLRVGWRFILGNDLGRAIDGHVPDDGLLEGLNRLGG